MKEKIFDNFSLKILSIIGAILLWGVIVNIYDPNTGVTISGVPVQLTNTESITDLGYSYEVLDGNKISVYVSGPKSVVTDIKTSDIVATADFSTITAFADYVDIQVHVEKNGKVLQNVEVTPKTTAVKLNIENRVTQAFDVKVEMMGNGSKGYVVLNDSVTPATIKVTGLSSAVQKIAQVKAVYDISDATADISDTASIVLYDYEGNVIEQSGLELSRTEVHFTANVGYSKTVDVIYQTLGTPAAGSTFRGIEADTNSAIISGEASLIDSIQQITIPIDINGITQNKEYRFWLSDYVLEGITVASNNYVNVKANIEQNQNTTISLRTNQIRIDGITETMQAELNDATLNITVSGVNNVSNTDASVLGAYVNVSGLDNGEHQVDIAFAPQSGISVVGNYTATVIITGKTQVSEETATQAVIQQNTQSETTTSVN